MSNPSETLITEQQTLFSRTVVDALSELAWLTNAERLDIADALLRIFVAEPISPDSVNIVKGTLESAANAASVVDDEFRRCRLSELSPERMAVARVLASINDLIQKADATKRPAGQLGWRKKETP